ncbi:60S ribosomal protein l23 [Trifolium pratense]|uniref:60S ribosomal protein l23 n=1 Tax=Trifolium pratense TaxID=57577 RepID=A0A2K3N4L3_TRIPR|nr:60S ribosomal protein l23 [Trifolium pratense]
MGEDKCAWNFTSHGEYSVRSAYHGKSRDVSQQEKDYEQEEFNARVFIVSGLLKMTGMFFSVVTKLRKYRLKRGCGILSGIDETGCCDSLHQWQLVRQKQQHTAAVTGSDSRAGTLHSSSSIIRWRKPGTGEVKCKIDAAIFKDYGCYGVGICLRGDNGEFIAAKTTWFYGLPQPQEAEACGLREAI